MCGLCLHSLGLQVVADEADLAIEDRVDHDLRCRCRRGDRLLDLTGLLSRQDLFARFLATERCQEKNHEGKKNESTGHGDAP